MMKLLKGDALCVEYIDGDEHWFMRSTGATVHPLVVRKVLRAGVVPSGDGLFDGASQTWIMECVTP